MDATQQQSDKEVFKLWLLILSFNGCLIALLNYFQNEPLITLIGLSIGGVCFVLSFLGNKITSVRFPYTITHIAYLSLAILSDSWLGGTFFHLLPFVASYFLVEDITLSRRMKFIALVAVVSELLFSFMKFQVISVYDLLLHLFLFVAEIGIVFYIWGKQLFLKMSTLELKDHRSQSLQVLLGVFCHDLSTPMMAISLICFQKRHSPNLPDEEKKAWDEVHHLIERERYLIENIRKVEKIASGFAETMDLNQVHPEEVYQKIREIFGERLQGKDLTLQYDSSATQFDDLTFMSDENILIYNIITNLMTNAIKFSERGSTIVLGAYRDHEEVGIFVKDQGEGISQENIRNLVEGNILRNTNVGTENEKGTGLGIKIVKNFVEILGGQLTIESRTKEQNPDDHGTKFIVLFQGVKRREDANVA